MLFLVRLELPLAADAGHGEVAILVLSDVASGDELLEQVQSCITFGLAVLHHLHLGLKDVVLLELGLGCLLLAFLCLLFGCDLLLAPSFFASFFKQTGRNSPVGYGDKQKALESVEICTYLKLRLTF